jgi:hypothetical protein
MNDFILLFFHRLCLPYLLKYFQQKPSPQKKAKLSITSNNKQKKQTLPITKNCAIPMLVVVLHLAPWPKMLQGTIWI